MKTKHRIYLAIGAGVTLDFPRFRRAFAKMFGKLPADDKNSMAKTWSAGARWTIAESLPAGVMSSVDGTRVTLSGAIVNKMDSRFLEVLIASALCEVLQNIDGLQFASAVEKQNHADGMLLRWLGMDASLLDAWHRSYANASQRAVARAVAGR